MKKRFALEAKTNLTGHSISTKSSILRCVCRKNVLGSLLWLTYDDIVTNLASTLDRIAKYYDYSFDLTQLDQIVSQSKSDKTYFNKGVSGRGKELLSDAQLDRIKSFFRHQSQLDRFIDF